MHLKCSKMHRTSHVDQKVCAQNGDLTFKSAPKGKGSWSTARITASQMPARTDTLLTVLC
eukprot:5797608-Amphidinium_carterae.1